MTPEPLNPSDRLKRIMGVPDHEVDQVFAATRAATGPVENPRLPALGLVMMLLTHGIDVCSSSPSGWMTALELTNLAKQSLHVLGVTDDEIRVALDAVKAGSDELRSARQRSTGGDALT